MDPAGLAAIVTGGGSGLGAATARRLSALGARVAILDFDLERAQAVADDCGGVAIQTDVSDNESVANSVAAANMALGQVARIVVNCAGIGFAARVVGRENKLSIDLFEKTLSVNLMGSYRVLSHAAAAMSKESPINDDGERGVIINTASVAYEDGQLGQSAYAASKGGVASMTLPIARELAGFGIRVMAIAPGLFETAMTAGLPDDIKAGIVANIPFPKRLGVAEEYAQLVQSIVENPFLNGSLIRLDGAVRLPPR
ncbi:MAG: SDR family NAD(P)-dependent oxidoreductase [Gammaproteobacteria bacterium]|nr:SDR family NAD(P)-dependent oxidoreductase [Gammaproteobacteria bacterium]